MLMKTFFPMKNLILKLVDFAAMAAIMVAGVAVARASAEVGQTAPDFTLTDIGGRQHRLADYKGKTVVLEWFNAECPFVKKHYESGNIPRTQQAAMADGVVWLIINSGHAGAQGDYEAKEAGDWLAKHDSAPTAYLRDRDGTVGRRYGAKTTPHLFIITPAGELVYQGAIDSIRSANKADIAKAENHVTTALAELKAGQPIAHANTPPYGCAVKY